MAACRCVDDEALVGVSDTGDAAAAAADNYLLVSL